MENFIIYMAKASGLIGLFFLAYYILLRKETFFASNRKFLLFGLLTAAILPLIVFTKTVWIDPQPQTQEVQSIDLQQLMQMQQLASAPAEEQMIDINWFDVAAGIYLAGLLLFLIRFIVDIHSIRKLLKENSMVRDGKYRLIDSVTVQSPFSFFNYIVYNSAVLQPEELASIITHEKVHSAQKHSADMIISQLFCAAFWFNPFVWLYKKSIAQNLEFIADAEATRQLADKKAYQKTLLKITVQPDCIAITNHFYQSLIKKRIVMLNKQQSKKDRSWKYAIVLPALAAFMFLFQVKVVAQEKDPKTVSGSYDKFKIAIEVTKDSNDEELAKETVILKEKFDADVTISNVTRNAAKEITGIKVSVKDKTQSKVYEVSGNDPISAFTIEIEKGSGSSKNGIVFGSPAKLRIGDEVVYANARIGDSIFMKIGNTYKDTVFYNKQIVKLGAFNKDFVPPSPPGDITLKSIDALVVVNGVVHDNKKPLPPSDQIASINVIKGKEAKKKYGRKAKKGVIEITTRPMAGNHVYITSPTRFSTIDLNDMNMEISPDIVINLDELKNNINASIDFKNMEIDMSENLKLAHIQLDMANEQFRNAGVQILLQRQQVEDILKNNPDDAQWENALKELNHAKKEIDEAVKELEDARKEFKKKSN